MRHTVDGARQLPGSQRLGRQAVRHPHMFGDPTIGDAIMDRVVHRAHRIELAGPSLRKHHTVNAPAKSNGGATAG